MTVYAYVFSANAIQRYIMMGGKVKEMVGASELIEQLTAVGGVLDDVLNVLAETGLQSSDYRFSRRGGGSFYVLFDDQQQAQQLCTLWSLVASGFAPQLSFNHAIQAGNNDADAIKKALARLTEKSSQPRKLLPQAGPLIRRAPRTGMPAVAIRTDPEQRQHWIDAAAKVKHQDRYAKGKSLREKYLGKQAHRQPNNTKHYIFPNNLEWIEVSKQSLHNPAFPFISKDNTYIGIIHIDGNGLGKILQNLARVLANSNDYAALFLELSEKINHATESAAQEAMQCVQDQAVQFKATDNYILPARPLILGGDDVTLIVRADLALTFTQHFLQAFEEASMAELESLHTRYPVIPELMTACGGIAFIKASQPFYQGYKLAESLCEYAKDSSRRVQQKANDAYIPSSFAFHQVTTTYIDTYAERIEREMKVTFSQATPQAEQMNKQPNFYLTMGAYGAGYYADKLPQYDALKALVALFSQPEMSRGAGRHFQTLLNSHQEEAKRLWLRWQDNMQKHLPTQYDDYQCHANKLFQQGKTHPQLPFYQRDYSDDDYHAFIGDLYTCLTIQGVQQDVQQRGQQ